MKKVIFLLTVICFSACSSTSVSSSNDLLSEAESYLKTILKDPDSYQKISSEIVDTITVSDAREEEIKLFYNQEMVDIGIVSQESVDSIVALPPSNEPSYLKVLLKYRARNSFGALDIGETMLYYHLILPPSGKKWFVYSQQPNAPDQQSPSL